MTTDIAIVRLLDLVFELSDKNRNEARRLIRDGAVSLNDAKFSNPLEHVVIKNGMVLKIGKKIFKRITGVRGKKLYLKNKF